MNDHHEEPRFLLDSRMCRSDRGAVLFDCRFIVGVTPFDPTATVPGPGMKPQFITNPRDEDWFYFVVPRALQSATLNSLADFSGVGDSCRY